MRRKVLVLLMTLSMMLSFMPMIAFADVEAEEIVPVKETAETEKAEIEDQVQDNEEAEVSVDETTIVEEESAEGTEEYTDETTVVEEESADDASQHTEKRQALNTLADSIDPEVCTHEDTDTYYEWYDEDVTYIDTGDNMYHSVTGWGEEVGFCMECGIELWREEARLDIEHEHDYDDNQVCTSCGHKNTCTHEETWTHLEWDEDKVKYTSIDNWSHMITGPGEEIIYCNDCGKELSRKTTQIEEERVHDYDDNHVCVVCGHKNTCTHKHTVKEVERDWDNAVFTDTGDNCYHKVKGPVEIKTYCFECGTYVDVKPDNIEQEVHHDYNSKHICNDCGHKNTCSHPSKKYEYSYDSNECTIVDTGDGFHHKVTGDIIKYTYCEVCEEEIEVEDLGNTTVTDNHYYNMNDYIVDVCVDCDYQRYDRRIFGNLRYDTAMEVAEAYTGMENVIVAYGLNFPDALSGGYLAKVKYAPILLVEPSQEERIVEYIYRNISYGGTVYILGGTGVVSSAFEKKVKAKGIDVKRLGGKDRYETNLAILKEAGVNAEDILVCTGAGFADSLSAAAVGKPILLVDNTISDAQKKYIKGLSTKQFYLIGGTGAVKPAIEKGLKDLGLKTERLAGSSRYETSTAVAKKFFAKAATIVLAYAQNFPDGLSGGPLAMMENAPIVLTDSKTTAAAQAYVKSAGVVKSITLGGPALISDIAVRAIMGR